MRLSDAELDAVRENGFVLVEGFLTPKELAGARAGLWAHYPTPEDYFSAPEDHARLGRSQFSGLRLFPYASWDLNRLAFHPDLVDAAERLLGSTALELYKIELWAKYAGAIDYDQVLHRDYGNHSLVVPRRDGGGQQITSFVLLSDVTELDGPTRIVPLQITRELPYVPRELEPGAFGDQEVPVVGPAGSLLLYRTDVFHRGSDFRAPGSSSRGT